MDDNSNWFLNLDIGSSLTPWILGAIGVLIIVWCVFRGRKHKRWYFWPLPLILPVLVLIAGSLVNNYFGLYPRLGDLLASYNFATGGPALLHARGGSYPQGITAEVSIPSPASGVGTQDAMVWLPPQYFSQPNTRFPVVYLIAGTPGDDADWSTGGNATQTGLANAQAGHPAILVNAPVLSSRLQDTECVNSDSQGNWQTYLTVDIPNYINENARTLVGPKAQAMAGLSMGGYCAQAAVLRNPTKFGVFGNFSGTSMPTYNGGIGNLLTDQSNPQQAAQPYSSIWIVKNQPQSRTVIGQDMVGEQDSPRLIADQKEFVSVAQSYGMNVSFYTWPGGHNFYFWAEALQKWLPWALSNMTPPSTSK